MASGEFAMQCNLGKVVIFHPREVPCLAQLCLQQQCLDACNLCPFKDFRVGSKVTPVDVEDGVKAVLMEVLEESQLAHTIRLLLEYTETPYEDKLYSCGEAPDYDKSQWIKEKETLGLDFPNLPYLIDGKTKLTQSNAIIRYISRKHNMCGETEEEICRVDMLENQVMDFRMSLVMVCYNPDFEKVKPGYLEQLPGKLKLFSQFLGDRKWFAGEKITFVDFLMYDVLDQNRMFEPKCLEQFKNLKDFLTRFEALEKIAAYMRSSRFMKTPINNKMAKWGNKKE